MRRLLRFLRPHAGLMAQTVGCNLAAAALDVFSFTLLIPFLDTLFGEQSLGSISKLQQPLLDVFIVEGDRMASLRNIIGVILVAVTLKNVLVWLSGNRGSALQEYVTRDLRDAIYGHLQRLPLSFFAVTKVGQVISRVLTDTQQTKQVLTEAVTRSLQSAATVALAIVALFLLSSRLALMSLGVAPLLIALLQPILRKLRQGHRRLGDQYGELTSIVQEAVNGIRLVKSYGAEAHEFARFKKASDRYSHGMVRVTRIGLLAQPLTETVATSAAMLILWFGAREVMAGKAMTGSMLVAFLMLVMRMLQPLKQLSQVRAIAQQSFAAADRLFDVMDQESEGARDRGTSRPATLERGLAFEDVSFAYGETPVLRNVTLRARRGEVVALVGPSGAGKSTLVDLIPRFYEPVSGRITLDDADIATISLGALRGMIGVVSQETVIFNDTVRHNIAYGSAGRFTDAQVEVAARAANAHEFIAQLPQGYQTILGERGTRLSGGQRQRIAIARALLLDPPILILDEATSALDTESERLVQEAIDRLLEGRTVFVIAHRLSTIQHATQIVVLDQGRIVEQGSHTELLRQNGMYRRLHAIQFGGQTIEAPL